MQQSLAYHGAEGAGSDCSVRLSEPQIATAFAAEQMAQHLFSLGIQIGTSQTKSWKACQQLWK